MGTEMTDDWMDDGQAIGSMDSEDEEDATKAEEKPVEEPSKPPAADVPAVASEKPAGIALPITEMTDDWMDDDVAMVSMDSEEEEEGPETDKGHSEKRVEEEVIQKSETKKSEEKKAPGIALPITEMTDDWMDDGAAFGSIDSEDEDAEKQSNLALPQPSYASIASHEVTQAAQEPELPTTDEVVVLKSGKSLPLVVNVEEKTDSDEDLKDSEGFEEVTTRKLKRKKKKKKKIKVLCVGSGG